MSQQPPPLPLSRKPAACTPTIGAASAAAPSASRQGVESAHGVAERIGPHAMFPSGQSADLAREHHPVGWFVGFLCSLFAIGFAIELGLTSAPPIAGIRRRAAAADAGADGGAP
jgi:hypothetical protein